MTDSQLSINAGRGRNFLTITRHYSPEKYDKMKELGIDSYIDESIRLRLVASTLYYDLLEKNALSACYRDYCRDLIKTQETFFSFIYNSAFGNANTVMSIGLFNKLTKLEKQYKEYKKEKQC